MSAITAEPTTYVSYQLLSSANFGGAERIALAIHRHLEGLRPGQSRLIAPVSSPLERLLEEKGESFTTYGLQRLLAPGRVNAVAGTAELLLRTWTTKPHLVHVHSAVLSSALKPFSRVSRGKIVLHVHLDYDESALRWALRSRPSLVITCADFMQPRVKKLIQEAGLSSTAVVTIRNSVDTNAFRPGDRSVVKAKLGLDPLRPVILHAGNLSPHKGQDKAIRAVAEVNRRSRHRPVLLVAGEERDGKDDFTRTLTGLTEGLGIVDSVRFLGLRSDVPDLLQAADVLLLPSTMEGLPLVVLEAQASNAVVIAAPTAGVPEIIEDGRTGFLVNADDVDGYAERLIRLFDDPSLGTAIATAARQRVERHHGEEQYQSAVVNTYDGLMRPRESA